MGIPVWVALPVAPDWRWMLQREDSPWYPTLRLFRQRTLGDWNEVFTRIVAALQNRLILRGSLPNTPVDYENAKRIHSHARDHLAEKRWREAEPLLIKLIQMMPDSTEVYQDLGVTYAKQGQLKDAIECFRRAIELQPTSTSAMANLGRALFENGQLTESVAYLKRAIRLGAGTPEIYNNLGVALANLPNPVAAEESFWAALRLSPYYLDAHYNLARVLLIQGKFEQGWQEYEWRWRWREKNNQVQRINKRKWAGERLNGRRILLVAEQGLGDTIQFSRYAPLVKRSGGHVIIQCQPALVELLAASGIADDVVPTGKVPHHDVEAALMSLPGLLHTTLKSIPATTPYLKISAELIAQWKPRLGTSSAVKVGIVWQGNAEHQGDKRRSIPLKLFEHLMQINGVEIYSLQQGPGSEQVKQLARTRPIRILDGADASVAGFLRTAAIIGGLDLVIGVDTAVIHLAGAMGIPTWVLLPAAPDWRWLLEREDSPWYPSMRLFRQEPPGHWNDIMERLMIALKQMVASRRGSPQN